MLLLSAANDDDVSDAAQFGLTGERRMTGAMSRYAASPRRRYSPLLSVKVSCCDN